MLADLYETTVQDRVLFGSNYTPPPRGKEREWNKVAVYKADGDGQTVEIYEVRFPARAYKIKVLAADGKEGVTLSTGSGRSMGALMVELAKQFSSGMIGVDSE